MADRQKHQDFEEAEGFLRSDFNKLAAYRRSTWKSFSSCRDVLFHLTLVILGILCITGLIFILVDLRENICTAGHIPKVSVGSDYTGGFVPNGVSTKPRLVAAGGTKYDISHATFKSTDVLNETVVSWNELAPGASFVSAGMTEWYGTEEPISWSDGPGVFQITGLHQMHCLTTILRDYSLMLQGHQPHELYDDERRSIDLLRGHSAHCFNALRQAVTCLADATALGHGADPFKVEGEGKLHMCNDYEALLDWVAAPGRKLPDNTRGGF